MLEAKTVKTNQLRIMKIYWMLAGFTERLSFLVCFLLKPLLLKARLPKSSVVNCRQPLDAARECPLTITAWLWWLLGLKKVLVQEMLCWDLARVDIPVWTNKYHLKERWCGVRSSADGNLRWRGHCQHPDQLHSPQWDKIQLPKPFASVSRQVAWPMISNLPFSHRK